jgi:hypothetical protein
LENLERLGGTLAGVARIYPGHGPAGGAELLDRQQQYLQRYREAVRKLAQGRSTLTDADKSQLTEQMTTYLPGGKINFLISAGADAVATELAEE